MAVLHPLAIAAPGAEPQRWLLFLHGLLGRGGNWRSFAERLVGAHPSWGAALVDLRLHGASQGLPPPHTVSSAAEDVIGWMSARPAPVRGVLGHSFGGKVALEVVRRRGAGLSHAFVIDSNPGSRAEGAGSETTLEVLALLRTLPALIPSRAAFLERVEASGQTRSVAQWLAMNLERVEGGFRVALDLPGVQALLDDYLARDEWDVLEALPPELRMEVVLGGRSGVFDAASRDRLERIAAVHSGLHVTVLPEAGHWVHVDDPEGLYRVVSGAL